MNKHLLWTGIGCLVVGAIGGTLGLALGWQYIFGITGILLILSI